MSSEIKMDELGSLMIVIDHLWAQLTADQVAAVEMDAPEIASAARIIHRVVWHGPQASPRS